MFNTIEGDALDLSEQKILCSDYLKDTVLSTNTLPSMIHIYEAISIRFLFGTIFQGNRKFIKFRTDVERRSV